MLPNGSLRSAFFACLLLSCAGCSSLGLSLFPTGHLLTDKTAEVISRSPRHVNLPRELAQGVVPTHYLQPGDGLLIETVDPESEIRIPADQQVMIDGTIDLAGFGRVVVAGLTLEMAENLVERTVVDAGEVKTHVNVRLLEPIDRYYVLGEVNSPGSYPLKGHETVLDAVLDAGGLTSSAAPCKILLARPTSPRSCRITLPVCYREITQLGDTTTNYQLQPGDRIFVASRSWCEELKFWHATKSCPRCCDCQTACLDPTIVPYPNPVTQTSDDSPRRAETDSSPFDFDEFLTDVDPIVREAPRYATDVVSSVPARLPPPVDGELDFESTEPSDRFEPLWLTPAAGR
jgi:polysaccharide export outer membrane protein